MDDIQEKKYLNKSAIQWNKIRQFDTWPTSVIVLDRVENFTRQLEKAKRWIRLCGRPHNQLNESILNERGKAKHLYVCSKHFIDGTPTDRYPDPIAAVATSYDSVTTARKPPTKRVHA
uniref:THAP-type domain-containing protein n=1 Tax=Magallana gigas TaxID=29159 RepID=K1QZH1_MAGGI